MIKEKVPIERLKYCRRCCIPETQEGVDFDEFAAQIDALDLVISMANTTVHFAGALDKPVWMLAPTQPSWRWQIDRPDSPWYRSVHIFRQGKDQMWGQVLGKIGDEIERWIDGRGKA